jgi:hypothetical protein
MKQLALAVTLLAACVSLNAQSIRLSADIPFEFWAGRSLLPAGQYTVERSHNSPSLVVLRSSEDTRTAMVLVSPADAGTAKPTLLFHRYGNAHFLAALWNSLGAAAALVPTAAEKEMASRFERVHLALKVKPR